MKICIRIATVFIIASLLFSQIASASFKDVTESRNKKAVDFLIQLKIMEGYTDGTFKANNIITRAEVAVVVAKIIGVEITKGGKGSFTDVKEGHWAYNSIEILNEMGIIKGGGDGKFAPDNTMTYEQFLKVLVCVLGYEPLALAKGGYPTGYAIIASQYGITKDVNSSFEKDLTRGDVALMLYNTLFIDIMQQTGFGKDATYSIEKGKNILTEKLKLNQKKGVVIATYDVSIAGEYEVKKDEVIIDYDLYKYKNNNANNFLGHYVTYYFKEDSAGNNEVVVITEDEESNNKEMIIKAEDISETNTVDIFICSGSNKEEKYNIANDAFYVYNGRPLIAPSDIDLKPTYGEVKLIDHDNDGVYDVVIIWSYENYTVESLNLYLYKITDRNGKEDLILDPNDNSYEFRISYNGKTSNINVLKEWNVLSVAESKNTTGKKLRTVIVSDAKYTGKISEYNEREQKVILDDSKEYKIGNGFNEHINIGDEGTFYLDLYGNISAFDKSRSMNKYGYLNAVATSSGIGEKVQFQIFTMEGKMRVFDGAKKITYKIGLASETLTGKEVISKLKPDGVFSKQLIQYDLNNEKEVYKIIIANDLGANGYDDNQFVFNEKINDLRYTKPYLSQSQAMYSNFKGVIANPEMVCFVISTREEENKVGDITILTKDINYPLSYIYDKNEYGLPGALVITSDLKVSGITRDHPVVLVDRITSKINSHSEIVFALQGYSRGKSVSLLTNSTEIIDRDETYNNKGKKFDSLQKGDLIQYKTDSNGDIDEFRTLFTVQNAIDLNIYIGGDGLDRDFAFYGTIVKASESNNALILSNSLIDNYPLYVNKNTTLIIYDKNRKSYIDAKINDITNGSKAFIYHSRPYGSYIIIIKD